MELDVLLLFSLLFLASEGKLPVTQTLDGNWTVKQVSNGNEYPATVPGGVYSDLMNAKVIEDVFSFYHDNDTRWVGQSNWTYFLNFTINASLLDYQEVHLVFEGVDTFAVVELNNFTVGTTQNMFVRYRFDVKDFLTEGNNTLKVTFSNAPEVALKLNTEQLEKYKIPRECPPDEYHGDCHINMIRKMQGSFSWDWGPSFPSMGIWKSVYLQAFEDTVIDYVVVRMTDNNDGENYLLTVDTYFAPNRAGYLNGTVTPLFYLSLWRYMYKPFKVRETLNEYGEFHSSVGYIIDYYDVQFWWPHGYGAQNMNKLMVNYSSNVYDSYSSKEIKMAVRFLELVQEPLNSGGTFYVKINEVPIFAKGANVVPINMLPELGQDRQKIRKLLQSAKEANMNMLRVTGSGLYQSDYFYEVADEMGIMIWQDFMFADSLYPATEDFLNNVRTEVTQTIKRLYYHPSVVIYSANHENEKILANNEFNTSNSFNTYKKDYIALYADIMHDEFERISGGTGVFIGSSPTNGNLTEREGWVGTNPNNQLWGDVHYDNYVLDPWSATSFPIPRFCSQYGYESMPSEDSWMTATNSTADLDVTGSFMNWRQHHPSGNEQMTELLGYNLQLPPTTSSNYTKAFIYLTQVFAAQATKVETEHYRRYRSLLTAESRGYTMGTLYRQLNDVWVAPTWSSVDFTGRWKMLHYFAKNFFADVILTGLFDSSGTLQLYAVNDQVSPINNVTVLLRVYSYNNFQPVNETSFTVDIAAASSQLIRNIPTDTFLQENNCDRNSCFFYFVARNVTQGNYAFPGKLKDSTLASPTVQISDVQGSLTDFNVTVTSDNVALFVWLDTHQVKGRFSDNGFLQVEADRTVSFHSDADVTLEELKGNLTVTHLTDPQWS